MPSGLSRSLTDRSDLESQGEAVLEDVNGEIHAIAHEYVGFGAKQMIVLLDKLVPAQGKRFTTALFAVTSGATAAIFAAFATDLRKSGTVFQDCPTCPQMVVIPAGRFMMGSPEGDGQARDNERPQREVPIKSPFAVSLFEVTFAEWNVCVEAGGCAHRPDDSGWGQGARPVINVSWDDISKEYLPWLSRVSGQTYRLLTEAEWEYAARAGTTTRY